MLLFSLAHPRWEFVFPPQYAAYLNSIELWWKVLRSRALKGRRFDRWDEVCQALGKPPRTGMPIDILLIWGRRRRHQPRRRPGIALPAKVA